MHIIVVKLLCACVVLRKMKTRKCIYRFIISPNTHTHTHKL